MNLIYETNKKLKYQKDKLEDLQQCLNNDTLSNAAINYILTEISKVEKNITYYSGLLKIINKESEK